MAADMEKLNYYTREPRPYPPPGRLDRRWYRCQDALVAAVAGTWAMVVLVGLVVRFADNGDLRPRTFDRGASELYRAARAQRTTVDILLLAGGAVCCAIAAGAAHRVRSSLRGWTIGWAVLIAICAIIGLLALIWSAAQLSRGF